MAELKKLIISVPYTDIIIEILSRGIHDMKCTRCGKDINVLNHFYIPVKNRKEGVRYCIKCAREENIVTLI